MKVLVTGVTGFLGGRVAQELAGSGHEVRGLVRDPASWSRPPHGAEVVQGDVTDAGSLRHAVRGCDAIIHLAALVKMWVRDRRQFDRVNVEGLRLTVDAARSSGAALLYASSFLALGPSDGMILDEESQASTRFYNDYHRTRWVADMMVRHLAASGLPLVRLYPGIVYGPGALTQVDHLVQLLLRHARGKLPGMLGRGDRRQCFALVDDVAAGFVAALERAEPGSAYILGGDNRTVRDLFRAFHDASGVAPPRKRIPYGMAAFVGRLQRWRAELTGIEPDLTDEVVAICRHEWAYSSARAEADLGYHVTPLEEGVRRTVTWLREIGELPSCPACS